MTRPLPTCTSQCHRHTRLRFFRQTPGALGIKASKPNLTVASSAITPALLELTACQPAARLSPRRCHCHCPGTGGGSRFLTDGLCLLRAAKGRVPLNGRLFGWRLAGWYNLIRRGSATQLYTAPKDHSGGPQEQAGYSLLGPATPVSTRCLFYFYVASIFNEKTPLLLSTLPV